MPNPKRTLLLLPLFGAFALCMTQATRAQAPAEPSFTLKQVGPNAWAAIDNPNAKQRAGANAGFAIGDDGVVVIDTHYHLDHVAGNGVFVEGGAVVLAQRNVRGWIHTENLKFFGDEIKSEQKAFIEGFARPMVVYDQAVDLYLGSREIHVRSFPGHTGGDSVVLIPDAKTVFGGDLFWRNTLPNLIDASTKPWVETLDVLATSEPGYTFVPGHGDVGNAQDVTAFREYLATLRKLVSDAQAQGMSGDALAQAVIPALTEKYGQWNFFKYLATRNILDTDTELSGKKRIPQAEMGK